MVICNLGSGSSGNCTYVASEDCKLLIDAGLPLAEIETRLHKIGVEPSEINAILITHEHGDHINGLKAFVKKYKVKVYAYFLIWDEICQKQFIASEFQVNIQLNDFYINDMLISPQRLSHDSLACIGYVIISKGHKVSIVTDTGEIPNITLDAMAGSNVIMIESNYNKQMLLDNPNYSLFLKRRILSKNGHLSNEKCAKYIIELLKRRYTGQFLLAHLSEKNNTPSVAYNEVKDYLSKFGIIEGKDIFIDVCYQNKVSTKFNIYNQD